MGHERCWMKLIADYVERAQQLDRLAAVEDDPGAKKALEEQAEDYFQLAVRRAKAMSLPMPIRLPL
jgi:hypothetical protein